MRRADLKTGVVYAYRDLGQPRSIVLDDVESFWTRQARTGELTRSTEKRYRHRYGYFGSVTGLLATYVVSGKQIVINPAKIIGTWEDYKVQKKADQEEYRRKSEARDQQRARCAEQAAQINALAAELGLPISTSDSAVTQQITNDVLIKLLTSYRPSA